MAKMEVKNLDLNGKEMIDINFISKMSPSAWVFWTSFLLSIITPGALALFSFREDLFFQLDFFKILLLSLSITFPVWAFNTLLVSLVDWDDSCDGTSHIQMVGAFGAILSLFPLYIPSLLRLLLVRFIVINSVSGLYIGLSIEIIIGIVMGWKIYKTNKGKETYTFTL